MVIGDEPIYIPLYQLGCTLLSDLLKAEKDNNMSKNIDELAEIARQAQQAYDTAKKAQQDAEKTDAPSGTVVATSTKDGLVWHCNASSSIVIQHTLATIEAAIQTFEQTDNTEAKLALAVAIILALEEVKQ